MATSSTLMRLLEINYYNGAVTEVVGPPGGGKTASITAWAAAMNRKLGGTGPADVRQRATMEAYKDTAPAFGLIVANLSAMDVPDVAGVGIPQRDTVWEKGDLVMQNARPSMWPVPSRDGQRGVVLLDEFRSADDSVRKPTSTLLLERWLNGRTLPEGWVVVLASNRASDNSGAFREFAMLNNRRCIVQFDSAYREWADWANKAGIPPIFVSFAEKHAGLIFISTTPDGDGAFASPRSYVKAIETWTSYLTGKPAAGVDPITGGYKLAVNADDITEWLPENMRAEILEAIAGWIGDAASRQLNTHVMYLKEMPDLQDILDNPGEAKIPGRTDARFVIGHQLAAHATEKTFASLIRYAKRLGDDIAIVFVQNAMMRTPTLYNTEAFGKWATENAAFAQRVLT